MTNGETLPSQEELYALVQARNADWDGRFYFGVVTTGVYCQPSCSSRTAKLENMRFFADQEAAQRAGFRPCKRCRPSENPLAAIIEVARFIEQNAQQQLTLAVLSARVGLSASRFQRVFKAAMGLSPKAYQDAHRRDLLKAALQESGAVTDSIYQAGFGSPSRVYGESSRQMGMTPGSYSDGAAGENIAYACRHTMLGPLMMAATQRGVCFAQFGEHEDALVQILQKEFPKAKLAPSPAAHAPALDDWIAALDDHLSRHQPRPELPLDIRGTAFQQQVWEFLIQIPPGQVVSYSELASGIGKPRAVRAAATACAANRIGVLIPCHRVLRSDGSLGGFRWGLERKKALLELESQAVSLGAVNSDEADQ